MKLLTRKRLIAFCIAFLVLDLLIVALLVGSIVTDNHKISSQRDALAKRIGITDEMDEEHQTERFAQAVGDASRLVTTHSELTVTEDGLIPISLSNSEENTCAVSFELALMETEEVIASSDLVDPGWYLEMMELNRELPGGTYFCLGRCSFYTMDGNVFLGQTTRQILLKVE